MRTASWHAISLKVAAAQGSGCRLPHMANPMAATTVIVTLADFRADFRADSRADFRADVLAGFFMNIVDPISG
jgi:hypothetical protein